MGQRNYYRIKETLEENEANFEMFEHEAVRTSEEAAEVRGVELKTGIKAMVFECVDEDKFIMALVPADRKVDVEKLESKSGLNLRLASPEEVKSRTGCEVGSVPPFGFKEDLETYMDTEIFQNERVNFNAGLHTRSIQMNSEDLKEIINPEACRISEDREG